MFEVADETIPAFPISVFLPANMPISSIVLKFVELADLVRVYSLFNVDTDSVEVKVAVRVAPV